MNMRITKSYISIIFLVVALSIPVSAANHKVQVENLYLTNAEVPIRVNSLIVSNDIPSLKKLAQTAANKAGFNVNLRNSLMKSGGFGTSFITDSIAVKVSEGEFYYKNSSESTRLMTITNKLLSNPPEGIDFCLPTHIFKIFIDYKDNRNDIGYNIQIAPSLKPKGDMWSMLRNCLEGHEKDRKTLRSFGEKLGLFQVWGLYKRENDHDLTFVHKDLNPNNIMLMSLDDNGKNATFKLIDISDCDDARTSNGGSLVSDPTYFIYRTFQGTIVNTKSITGFLEDFFSGYVPQIPKNVCKKLKDSFYRYGFKEDDGCYDQMRKDISYKVPKKAGVPKIQSDAFTKAYNLTFPEAPLKQPDPVFKGPEKNQQPIVIPADFDHQFYLDRAPLLKESVEGKSLAEQQKAAEEHYINYGKSEGRPYKGS